tara:strand:+ start:2410 stop:2754 length:345 start_codon:yes stop_codon:yes gene_type:complete
MSDCLFCKIVTGDIPATKIYEDDQVIAFNDIDPKAPTHMLIIPKQHISTLNDVEASHKALIGHMVYTAKHLAKEHAHDEAGYRLVMNCNEDGGQTVYHLHMHLLAGRQMDWPPG